MNILMCMPMKDSMTNTFMTSENKELLDSLGNITYNESMQNYTQEELKTNITNKDIVIIGWKSPVIDEEVLKNANKLKLIVFLAGSVSPFICEEVYNRGIKVICGNEVMAKSVAEGIVAYILSFNRDISKFSTDFKEKGMWKPQNFTTFNLINKTVGIISYGSISKYLAKMLYGFDVNILVYSRSKLPQEDVEKYNIKQVSMSDLFSQSDFISLQTALNKNTLNMIDKKYFPLIKDNAVFINTARAKVVNEEDFIAALDENRFKAIIDVYAIEPLPKDNPYAFRDNVFMMPHMAGPTIETRELIAKTLFLEVLKGLDNIDSLYEVDLAKFHSMSVVL